MTVKDLIEVLQGAPADAEVMFDTEAARFVVHYVGVDSAYYEPEICAALGREVVVLHTEGPRIHGGSP